MSDKGCCAVVQTVEADKVWLKKSASEARAVKMSLVQQHYPQLVSDFLQKEKSGASKQIQVNKKKADAKVCANCPGSLWCKIKAMLSADFTRADRMNNVHWDTPCSMSRSSAVYLSLQLLGLLTLICFELSLLGMTRCRNGLVRVPVSSA